MKSIFIPAFFSLPRIYTAIQRNYPYPLLSYLWALNKSSRELVRSFEFLRVTVTLRSGQEPNFPPFRSQIFFHGQFDSSRKMVKATRFQFAVRLIVLRINYLVIVLTSRLEKRKSTMKGEYWNTRIKRGSSIRVRQIKINFSLWINYISCLNKFLQEERRPPYFEKQASHTHTHTRSRFLKTSEFQRQLILQSEASDVKKEETKKMEKEGTRLETDKTGQPLLAR